MHIIELLATESLRSAQASREDCRAGGDQRAWHGNWLDWGDVERVATCQHWKGRVQILSMECRAVPRLIHGFKLACLR